MAQRHIAPERVTLAYREVGKTHVFTTQEFRGFHVGSSDLKTAYQQAAVALGEHVSNVCGVAVRYEHVMSFEDFRNHLGAAAEDDVAGILGNYVIAKKAEALVPA